MGQKSVMGWAVWKNYQQRAAGVGFQINVQQLIISWCGMTN